MALECMRDAMPKIDEWTLTVGNPLVQCIVELLLWYETRREKRALKLAKMIADYKRHKAELKRQAEERAKEEHKHVPMFFQKRRERALALKLILWT